MRVDLIELNFAARRHRAKAIARLIATAFAWLVQPGSRSHAARPHFAR
jgi:hypothetical protein